jgi:hypothetical protein
MNLTLYSIPREILFDVFVQKLNIEFSKLGSLWCEAYINEETANKLIAVYGNRVYLIQPWLSTNNHITLKTTE